MAKKMVLAIIAAMIVVSAVNAQEKEQKEGLWDTILNNMGFAPGVEGTKVFINGGIGFEIPFSNASHNMPPVSVSVDYVPSGWPFSFGGKLAFSTVKFSGAAIDDSVNVDIGLRMAVHSNILKSIKNLDISALATLGIDFATGDTYKALKDSGLVTFFDGFYLGIGLGGRYFFTKNIGAFLEADFKVIQKMSVGASAGLALKF